MGSSEPDTLIQQLILDLGSDNLVVRENAEAKLRSFGSQAVEPLKQRMFGQDKALAWRSARILSQISDPRIPEIMRMALHSEFFLVGEVAVGTLLGYAANLAYRERVIDDLLASLPTSQQLVQLHILNALEQLPAARSVAPL